MKQEQGAALIIAMLIMVLLVAIGMSLMKTSSQDLKMADAAAERKMLMNMLEGANDEALAQGGISTTISNLDDELNFSSAAFAETGVTMTPRGEYDCKRSFNASSTNVMTSCKYVDIRVSSQYGKGNVARLSITAGVEQGIINGQ